MADVKLNFVHVCDQVLISEGKASIINIFNEIGTVGFPAIYPRFAIITNVSGDAGIYIQKIEIISIKSNEVVASINGNTEIKELQSNNFVVNFINLPFPAEGMYWIKIEINGEILTKKEESFITIKKAN